MSNQIKRIISLLKFISHPKKIYGWVYGAYLTLRYVDDYNTFPAIRFKNQPIRLKITKGKKSYLSIKGRININPWLGGNISEIKLADNAEIHINNDIILGDDIHIKLSSNAKLVILGKKHESGSGITARSILLVKKHIHIGSDVIIAWDTFLTDSDWHEIDNHLNIDTVWIDDHVWIANGVKILPGTRINKNCIVGCGAVITGGEFPERSLIGGVPAKVIQTEIADWKR